MRISQLVDARDGSHRPASEVIDPGLTGPVAAIGKTLEGKTLEGKTLEGKTLEGKTLEGKTERQSHPHAEGSLAWIVARLGGWNCCYKPPGTNTMAIGGRQLAAMVSGYVIAAPALAACGQDV